MVEQYAAQASGVPQPPGPPPFWRICANLLAFAASFLLTSPLLCAKAVHAAIFAGSLQYARHASWFAQFPSAATGNVTPCAERPLLPETSDVPVCAAAKEAIASRPARNTITDKCFFCMVLKRISVKTLDRI